MAKLARGIAGGGWKASLAAVLKAHNNAKVDGSVASHATRDKRADVLYAGFKLLREQGYKLDTVHSFRGKHMEVLAKAWEERGLSPSTLQNNLSTFRIFAGWIGWMITLAFSRSSSGAASTPKHTPQSGKGSRQWFDLHEPSPCGARHRWCVPCGTSPQGTHQPREQPRFPAPLLCSTNVKSVNPATPPHKHTKNDTSNG